MDSVLKNATFGETTAILEVGPGYGRLLDTLLRRKIPFERYLGVELSPDRVGRLRQKYKSDPRIRFLCSDVETFRVDDRWDVFVSSATFSHLFPNFDYALANVRSHLKVGGIACFDVSEGGTGGRFQDDGITYGRVYTESEISATFHGSNFGELILDRVTHGRDQLTGTPVEMLFVGVKRVR